MQDLIDQARKNGISLLDRGDCQFCGAWVSGGVFECHTNFYSLAERLDFNDSLLHVTRFLSVDAMALQHSEVHGPWNNHLHLTRLFLIFEKGVEWTYAKTPLLSTVINDYKKDRKEFLAPPPLMQRGDLTTSDLIDLLSTQEAITLVRQWAHQVYTAYHTHHKTVALLADNYLNQYY